MEEVPMSSNHLGLQFIGMTLIRNCVKVVNLTHSMEASTPKVVLTTYLLAYRAQATSSPKTLLA
ncbi:hypothetical protein ACTXT7_007323 [Hymenolepis weldensis]